MVMLMDLVVGAALVAPMVVAVEALKAVPQVLAAAREAELEAVRVVQAVVEMMFVTVIPPRVQNQIARPVVHVAAVSLVVLCVALWCTVHGESQDSIPCLEVPASSLTNPCQLWAPCKDLRHPQRRVLEEAMVGTQEAAQVMALLASYKAPGKTNPPALGKTKSNWIQSVPKVLMWPLLHQQQTMAQESKIMCSKTNHTRAHRPKWNFLVDIQVAVSSTMVKD